MRIKNSNNHLELQEITRNLIEFLTSMKHKIIGGEKGHIILV
jgi:hypothetical protein